MGLLRYNQLTDELDYVAVEDGTAAGQLAFWDTVNWTPAETSELVWDDTNKRFGVGVASPDDTFHVHGTDGGLRLSRVGSDGVLRCYASADDFVFQSNHADGDIIFKTAETSTRLVLSSGGNLGFGTATFGTSAAGTVAFANGTAPTANVANQHAYYSADFAAGNACPYFRTENGTVIGLNQSLLTTDSFTFAGGTMNGDLAMGDSYQITGLQAPAAAGEALRQTTNITEADLEQLTDGSDTTLHDHDGISENTSARHSNALDHSNAADHTQGTDTALGTMAQDIDMNNSFQVVNLQAPAANGEAIRATAKITEVKMEAADDHVAATGNQHGHDTHDHSTALGTALAADLSDITSAGADIEDAVTKKHANTLDHTQGTDTTLGTMAQDIDMDGSYQVVGLQAPGAAGEAIRQTAKITEAKMEAADDHVAATGNQHGHDTHDHSTALGTAAVADLGDTTATGAELNTLTDNSMGDALHRHSELSASDGTPDAALQVDASGYVGIGTAAIPHGGIGAAKLALEGTNGSTAGPHIQITTDTDDYPIFQFLSYAHDNIALIFDAYWDGGWKSSDEGSNFTIYKTSDKLQFRYGDSPAAGEALSWTTAMVIDAAGQIGIWDDTPSTILEVVAASASDPVADAWDTHCGRHNQVDLGEAIGSRLEDFAQVKLYNYKRKPNISDAEVVDEIVRNWETESQVGFEDKRMQLEAAKAQLPKFAATRVGIMMDDPNVPSEILTFDDVGNKTGISGNGYIGYLHKVIRDQQVVLEEFGERITALEQEQG